MRILSSRIIAHLTDNERDFSSSMHEMSNLFFSQLTSLHLKWPSSYPDKNTHLILLVVGKRKIVKQVPRNFSNRTAISTDDDDDRCSEEERANKSSETQHRRREISCMEICVFSSACRVAHFTENLSNQIKLIFDLLIDLSSNITHIRSLFSHR